MSISKALIVVGVVVLALVGGGTFYALKNADHSVLMALPASSNLSSTLPGDVAPGADATAIDDFSWKSFVAINWPADGKGVIGAKGDNVAVWQFWKQDADILVPTGQTPIPWKTPSPIPPICKQVAPPGTRILTHTTKGGELGAFTTPGNGPLIDQNLEYVRFEILVNEPMYDFIVTNNLYTMAGQMAYKPGGTVVFPAGAVNGPPGAVMIKISWKILSAGDNPKLFHTALAYIYDPGTTPSCVLKQVGLVGLHISHKTVNAPQWVWSTFEHINNAPLVGAPLQSHYNFSNGQPANSQPGCDKAGICNAVPQGKWDPNSKALPPVEVARLDDLTPTAKANNASYIAALKAINPASVFANYQLIGTQFPSDVKNQAHPDGLPAPKYLANSTMETFLQGTTPGVSSSCGNCHLQANMSDGRLSDFSFILARVKN